MCVFLVKTEFEAVQRKSPSQRLQAPRCVRRKSVSNDDEAKKCFKCSHIDYFVYKRKTSHFAELLDLATKEDCLAEYVFDVKISRALEAFLTCLPYKLDSESLY